MWADGLIEILDSKGYETKEFKRKWKMLKEKYPHLSCRMVKESITAREDWKATLK